MRCRVISQRGRYSYVPAHGWHSVGHRGEEGKRASDQNNAQEGDEGGNLLHAGKGLSDEVRACPAGEAGGKEGKDGRVGEWEVEEGIFGGGYKVGMGSRRGRSLVTTACASVKDVLAKLTIHAEYAEEAQHTSRCEKRPHFSHAEGEVLGLLVPHVIGRTQDSDGHAGKENLEGMIAFAWG